MLLILLSSFIFLAQSETIVDIKNRYRSEITSNNDWVFYGIKISETGPPMQALTVGVSNINQTITWPSEFESGIYATLPKQVIQMESPVQMSRKRHRHLNHHLNTKKLQAHQTQTQTQTQTSTTGVTTIKVGTPIARKNDLKKDSGTVGFFVKVDSQIYLITNEHVVAKGETAVIPGDGDQEVEIGECVGAIDDTHASPGDNKFNVDASVIRLNEGFAGDHTPPDGEFALIDTRLLWGSAWGRSFLWDEDIFSKMIGTTGIPVTSYGDVTKRQAGILIGYGQFEMGGQYGGTVHDQLLIYGGTEVTKSGNGYSHSEDDVPSDFGQHGDSGKVIVMAEAEGPVLGANDDIDVTEGEPGQILGLFWGGDVETHFYYASPMPKVFGFIADAVKAHDGDIEFI